MHIQNNYELICENVYFERDMCIKICGYTIDLFMFLIQLLFLEWHCNRAETVRMTSYQAVVSSNISCAFFFYLDVDVDT